MKITTAAVIAVERSSVEQAQSGAMLQAEEALLATQPALWTPTSEYQHPYVHGAPILQCLFLSQKQCLLCSAFTFMPTYDFVTLHNKCIAPLNS